MERQLELLEPREPEWRLDDETRAVGRQGIAEARKVLQRARAAARDDSHHHNEAHAA